MRWTVRRLMVAVAVVAIILASLVSFVQTAPLAMAYRYEAKHLARLERHDREMAVKYHRMAAEAQAAGQAKKSIALMHQAIQARQCAEQFAKWKRDYERLAWQPWRSPRPRTIRLSQPPPSPRDSVRYMRAMGAPATIIVLSCLVCLGWLVVRGFFSIGSARAARDGPEPRFLDRSRFSRGGSPE